MFLKVILNFKKVFKQLEFCFINYNKIAKFRPNNKKKLYFTTGIFLKENVFI